MTRFKKVSDEVWVAEDNIVRVDRAETDRLKEHASRSPRHRARLCAHRSASDRLHEMLIVLTRDVYIRPHKHMNKPESFHVIEGSATVVFFDDAGKAEDVIHIGDARSGKEFYFRNDDARYHTQIITSEYLVFHEITTGPFDPAQTIYAPWAPAETDDGVEAFMDKLRVAHAEP